MTYLFTALAIMLTAYCINKFFSKKEKKADEQVVLVDANLKPLLKPLDADSEDKIRKYWLRSLFIFTGFSVLGLFEGTELDLNSFLIIAKIIFRFIGLSLWFWITYHCAYKKRGTAWLMFELIVIPIGNLVAAGALLKEDTLFISDGTELGYFWTSLIIIPGLCIAAYFWINCFRLRKVNSARKQHERLDQQTKEAPMQDVSNIISV